MAILQQHKIGGLFKGITCHRHPPISVRSVLYPLLSDMVLIVGLRETTFNCERGENLTQSAGDENVLSGTSYLSRGSFIVPGTVTTPFCNGLCITYKYFTGSCLSESTLCSSEPCVINTLLVPHDGGIVHSGGRWYKPTQRRIRIPPHILNRLLVIRRIRDTVAFAD